MLHRLSIKNFVLVESLDLTFDKGLSVITGETGAGKSVMISALGLILGQRADTKAIKEGCDRCVLEAEFTDIDNLRPFFEAHDLEYDEPSCIIRRELSINGKSRAFVNDSPISLGLLKDLGAELLDIHSQHENLWLGKDSFQLEVLDTIAQSEDLLQQYRLSYYAYEKSRKDLIDLEKRLQEQAKEQDYMQFQYQQLHEAALQTGEEESLESRRDMLEHAEEIKAGLDEMEALFAEERGICALLKTVISLAARLRKHLPDMDDIHSRLDTCLIELKDIQRDVERWSEQSEVDPQALDRINERLNLLYDLQQKHRCTHADDLIEIRDNLAAKLQEIEQADDSLQAAKAHCEQSLKEAKKWAAQLSKKRRSVLPQMETYMMTQLQQLGMPHACFKVEIEDKTLDANGCDKVCFLFSANKNVPVQSITQIASGGEISRLMLCLKALMAELSSCACLLFDEIDTGVSGEIAHRMALLMQNIALHRQVLCITHLPQIAAKGRHHYKVYKSDEGEQTISKALKLTDEERVLEIAKMMSGDNVSQAALDNAQLLLSSC